MKILEKNEKLKILKILEKKKFFWRKNKKLWFLKILDKKKNFIRKIWKIEIFKYFGKKWKIWDFLKKMKNWNF